MNSSQMGQNIKVNLNRAQRMEGGLLNGTTVKFMKDNG